MSSKQDKQEKEEKWRTPSPISTGDANGRQQDQDVLEELKKLRKENQEGHNYTKISLERVEQTVKDIKDQLTEHEERIEKVEERISTVEDITMRHQRALKYLLQRDVELTAKCDELENKMRRNNIRIYQIPEGSKGKDTAGFVKKLLNVFQVNSGRFVPPFGNRTLLQLCYYKHFHMLGCHKFYVNVLMDAKFEWEMSETHSIGPLMYTYISVIGVLIALGAILSPERTGHTSLPQYQRGLDTENGRKLCLTGQMEVYVQFLVIEGKGFIFYFFIFLSHSVTIQVSIQARRNVYHNIFQRIWNF